MIFSISFSPFIFRSSFRKREKTREREGEKKEISMEDIECLKGACLLYVVSAL
jgi:hypothetical protein